MNSDPSVQSDLCTLYFDHDFKDFHKLCNLLNTHNVQFVSNVKSGLRYVPRFQYRTISFLNESTIRLRVSEALYKLNIPESQIRTTCGVLLRDILRHYNHNVTKWFNTKLGEKHLVDHILQFTGHDDWWVYDNHRICVRQLLRLLSDHGYMLFGHRIVRTYLLDHHVEPNCTWNFRVSRNSQWQNMMRNYLEQNNLDDLTPRDLAQATCTFSSLEVKYITLNFFPCDYVPVVDINGLNLNAKGIPSVIPQLKENVDFYFRKIQKREMGVIDTRIEDRVRKYIDRKRRDGWFITNVCYNKRTKQYIHCSEVSVLESRLQSAKLLVDQMQSELSDTIALTRSSEPQSTS